MHGARNLSGAHILQIPYDSGRRNFRMGNGPARIAEQVCDMPGISSEILTVEERPFEVGTTFRILRAASAKLKSAVDSHRLPIVLAGNCINTLASMAALGSDTALFWFDAHADFNTPETTPSGFIDGMALAAMTGRCWRNLTASVPGFRPMPEKNVVLIGVRNLDPDERTSVEQSEIGWITAELISKNGAENAVGKALPGLPKSAYLHIDLDVLDREEARVNEYSSSGGLTIHELLETIRFITHNRAIVGASITAYDPSVDHDSKGLNAAVATVKELLTPLAST